MAGIRLVTSNRMERLAGALADDLASSPQDPLVPERIIVPNRGVGRYISLTLAAQVGTFANFAFLYPDTFLEESIDALIPDIKRGEFFRGEKMVWRLYHHLGEISVGEFGEVERYLTGEGSGEGRQLDLAKKCAELFELYQIFRPELLVEWRGGGGGWQGALWRLLQKDEPGGDKASRFKKLLDLSLDFTPPAGALPLRVSLFGAAMLAPVRVEALKVLSRWIDITLYLVNPSEQFWGDIISEKEIAKKAEREGVDADELYLESGHPLLASLGKLGREFFSGLADFENDEGEIFETPVGEDILATLQRDILTLPEVGQPLPRDPNDTSIDIRACHTPMREVEVLHDKLLGLFNSDKTLKPRDILIATPHLFTYAPLIDAVFGSLERSDNRHIPYTIADRSIRDESGLIEGFLRLLGVISGRMGLSQLLDLLEHPKVAARFEIGEEEVEVARSWLLASNVRWGIDGKHRETFGVPPVEANSWREALKRLLLGYAMRCDGTSLFDGLLPLGGAEGGESETLGSLLEFCEKLFALDERARRPRNLGGWGDLFKGALDEFFVTSEDEESEAKLLRKHLTDLGDFTEAAGEGSYFPAAVIISHLTTLLGEEESPGGYLMGKVTVSAMRPLRSIPFRVVALLGMEDASYPRRESRPGFDMMAAEPRPGDPSLGDEDRYLFLEMLLSARDTLYISYLGQSAKDNKERQPSILVSELVNSLAERFGGEGKDYISQERLQGFSPDYFNGTEGPAGVSGFSVENFAGAKRLVSRGKEERPFVGEPLPKASEEWRRVELRTFHNFFRNPAKAFMERTLGARFEGLDENISDREPFALDGLERYKAMERLGEALLHGKDAATQERLFTARGELPHGALGKAAFNLLEGEVQALVKEVLGSVEGELTTLPFDEVIEGVHLTGTLGELSQGGLITYRPAEIKATDRLFTWINHLLLCHLRPAGVSLVSTHFGRDGRVTFGEVANPQKYLKELAYLYLEGARRPLPLFPKASFAFAQKIIEEKGDTAAIKAARDKWSASWGVAKSESENPYFARCFGEALPVDGDFIEVALKVYGPLLEWEVKK